MDILHNEILPLFNSLQTDPKPELNQIIQTGLNQYTIYVKLAHIFSLQSQTHHINIDGVRNEYTIPLHYHEIVFSNKGLHGRDLLVRVKSIRDTFIRVNSHDLLIILPNNEVNFKHLDGRDMVIKESRKLLHCIKGEGLPRPNRLRGDLYIVTTGKKEICLDTWLEILNYDESYCNVEVDEDVEVIEDVEVKDTLCLTKKD